MAFLPGTIVPVAEDTTVQSLVVKVSRATGRSQQGLLEMDSEDFLRLAEDVAAHEAKATYTQETDFRKLVVGGQGPFLFQRSNKKCFTFQLDDYPPLTVNLGGLLDQHRPQTILSAAVVADAFSCAWGAHCPNNKAYRACFVNKDGRLVLAGRYSVKVLQSQNNDCAEALGFGYVLSPAYVNSSNQYVGKPRAQAVSAPVSETEQEGAKRLLRAMGHCTTCGALTSRLPPDERWRTDTFLPTRTENLCDDCAFGVTSAAEAKALSKELKKFHRTERLRTQWPWAPIFAMYLLAIIGGA